MSMFTEIPLSRGLVALVDEEDCERVTAAGKWSAREGRNTFYAIRSRGRNSGMVMLHTFLTGWPLTDHINGDGLDNRRANLRPATHTENLWNRGLASHNTSGFKGVSWNRNAGKWAAGIRAGGRKIHLGYHATPEAAARAYDAAAREHFGGFAYLNFPGEAS